MDSSSKELIQPESSAPESNNLAPIIRLRHVGFDYENTRALSDVNLDIERGAFIAVIGPNGGGKTTLMRLILGLLSPTQGEVLVFDERPGTSPTRIGYVPQHSNTSSSFPASVEQVVLMGLAQGNTIDGKRRGIRYSPEERALAEHAMRRAGVLDLRKRRLNELSGGQRQRVLIARALITEPELLILDEPLSNIDPFGRQCILETLTGLDPQTTVVMVSHDLGITANAVTGIIAVNHFALASLDAHLTPAMLDLMYGIHEAGCPVHSLLQQMVETMPGETLLSQTQGKTTPGCGHDAH
jgi:zinc transport system ATP-binding protein